MLLLLAALALAQPAHDAPGAEPPVVRAALAEDLLVQASDRMAQGDLDGADLLLDEALRRAPSPDNRIEIAYQRANIHALRRDYVTAREHYARVAELFPQSLRGDDARFRVAELDGVLGDPEAAIEGLTELRPWRRLPDSDADKVRLNRAIFTVEAGDVRRGMRRLRRALRRTEPGTVSFYEAKAWAHLAEGHLRRGDAVPFEAGSERRLRRALRERQQRILAAEGAIKQAIALKEPEWVLEGLLLLASSYERFGDDLLAVPEPDLTPEQLALYRQGVHREIEPVWLRAESYLSEGLAVAERLDWESRRVPALEQALARVRTKVERL